jgi:hypothetical protein
MNDPLGDLAAARSTALGTGDFADLPGRHVACLLLLNQSTELLADFVGGNFDLVVMGDPRPLFDGLNLAGDIRRLLQTFRKFLFE